MAKTIEIEGGLLRDLLEKAAREGQTLQEVVTDMLQQELARAECQSTYCLELEGWEAELQTGVDVLDRDTLGDLPN